jgi:hypothetical protein
VERKNLGKKKQGKAQSARERAAIILKEPIEKNKEFAFTRKLQITLKLILENQVTEQVNYFNFLGCYIPYLVEVKVNKKTWKV